jgi:hypothetical protein
MASGQNGWTEANVVVLSVPNIYFTSPQENTITGPRVTFEWEPLGEIEGGMISYLFAIKGPEERSPESSLVTNSINYNIAPYTKNDEEYSSYITPKVTASHGGYSVGEEHTLLLKRAPIPVLTTNTSIKTDTKSPYYAWEKVTMEIEN